MGFVLVYEKLPEELFREATVTTTYMPSGQCDSTRQVGGNYKNESILRLIGPRGNTVMVLDQVRQVEPCLLLPTQASDEALLRVNYWNPRPSYLHWSSNQLYLVKKNLGVCAQHRKHRSCGHLKLIYYTYMTANRGQKLKAYLSIRLSHNICFIF